MRHCLGWLERPSGSVTVPLDPPWIGPQSTGRRPALARPCECERGRGSSASCLVVVLLGGQVLDSPCFVGARSKG